MALQDTIHMSSIRRHSSPPAMSTSPCMVAAVQRPPLNLPPPPLLNPTSSPSKAFQRRRRFAADAEEDTTRLRQPPSSGNSARRELMDSLVMSLSKKGAAASEQIHGVDATEKPAHDAPQGYVDYFSKKLTIDIRKRDEEEHIKYLEEKALTHFKNSCWEDVIQACDQVLGIPGQAKTNFDVLYEMGYAHMRLESYEAAVRYFMEAHRIDGGRVMLKLAMNDLRRKLAEGPWRMKRTGVERQESPKRLRKTSPEPHSV